jgi:hypothetical protein
MQGILDPHLTLVTFGANVTVAVTFTARFTKFERNMADLGLAFASGVDIVGVDPEFLEGIGGTGERLFMMPGIPWALPLRARPERRFPPDSWLPGHIRPRRPDARRWGNDACPPRSRR